MTVDKAGVLPVEGLEIREEGRNSIVQELAHIQIRRIFKALSNLHIASVMFCRLFLHNTP